MDSFATQCTSFVYEISSLDCLIFLRKFGKSLRWFDLSYLSLVWNWTLYVRVGNTLLNLSHDFLLFSTIFLNVSRAIILCTMSPWLRTECVLFCFSAKFSVGHFAPRQSWSTENLTNIHAFAFGAMILFWQPQAKIL